MNPFRIDTDTQCLIFKTNIANDLEAARLNFVLERTRGVKSWNLDLEDHDHVLRINFSSVNLNQLRINLFRFKIYIKELPIW